VSLLDYVNLSAGAVYLYYKSKDELILAAIATYIQKLRELYLLNPPDNPPIREPGQSTESRLAISW
jgi:AcrR family transcriptional regulator